MPRLWMILVSLILGALVNVAVAWRLGGVATADRWTLSGKMQTSRGPFVFHVAESFGRDRFLGILAADEAAADTLLRAAFSANGVPRETMRGDARPPGWALAARMLRPIAAGQMESRVLSIASGWPMRSMVYHRPYPSVAATTIGERVRQGLVSPFDSGQSWHKQYVPLLPIWLGFIVNTVVYTSPFYLLFWGGLALRRRLRRRRNICEKCGYDLRGIGGACPECGTVKGSSAPVART